MKLQESIPVGCIRSAAVAVSGAGLPGSGGGSVKGGVCPEGGVRVCRRGCLPRGGDVCLGGVHHHPCEQND